jgi:hypothetical protein
VASGASLLAVPFTGGGSLALTTGLIGAGTGLASTGRSCQDYYGPVLDIGGRTWNGNAKKTGGALLPVIGGLVGIGCGAFVFRDEPLVMSVLLIIFAIVSIALILRYRGISRVDQPHK